MNVQTKFLQLLDQLKVYHWQTTKYSRHMAFGASYDALSPLVDAFIESYLGTLDKRLAAESFDLKNLSEYEPKEFCLEAIESIKEIRESMEEYPDLINIADEMIAVFGKLKYLLTLE